MDIDFVSKYNNNIYKLYVRSSGCMPIIRIMQWKDLILGKKKKKKTSILIRSSQLLIYYTSWTSQVGLG